MFQTSVIYEANYTSEEDINVNQGGTSSGKTYSILQVLDTLAVEDPGSVITVVGQDIPNLKAGALRDQMDIVASSPQLQSYITDYNKSDRIYTFFNGSLIEFKSYGSAQDAKSGKRDYLFVNEANGISYGIFDELNTRTKKKTFIDYNPNAEFWVHNELIGKPNVKLIISDYRHNPYCPKKIIEKIESRRESDPEWFKVYGRGMTGRIEGLVFKNWYAVPSISPDAKFLGYCLDFGYTNDVTYFGEVWLHQGELWLNELIYETGLVNVLPKDSKHFVPNINDRLKELGISKGREIIADSAEQKSVDELAACGWNIRAVKKYPGSVKDGIDIMKRYRINVTQRSTNLRKEFNAYRWKVDRITGLTLNEPVDVDNHGIDASRYVCLDKLARTGRGKYSVL